MKPFEGIFGNTCELRIIEFLLPLKGIGFNISELAEEAGVSRATAAKVINKFIGYGIMTVSREQDGTKHYKVNPGSPFVKLFEDLNNIIIEELFGW